MIEGERERKTGKREGYDPGTSRTELRR